MINYHFEPRTKFKYIISLNWTGLSVYEYITPRSRQVEILHYQGAVSIRKTVFPGMAIPMLKIRRPTGRLIFNMGIPIPGKTVFYIETGPWS